MDLLTEHESYQDLAWSVGVRLRGNLDKIYTWAEKYGLAQDFRKVNLKLSEAADLASDSKFNYRKIIQISHWGHIFIFELIVNLSYLYIIYIYNIYIHYNL